MLNSKFNKSIIIILYIILNNELIDYIKFFVFIPQIIICIIFFYLYCLFKWEILYVINIHKMTLRFIELVQKEHP